MNAEKPSVYSTKCIATARAKWRVLSNYKHYVCNCPINAQIRLLIANHVREFCYSFDYPSNRLTETCSFGLPFTSLILDIYVTIYDTCQNKVSADQYHVTISRAQVCSSSRSRVFLS